MTKSVDCGEYISLNDALTYATKALKSRVLGIAVLRDALGNGEVSAFCKAIVEEYAYGKPKSFDRRKIEFQISVLGPVESAKSKISKELFKKTPLGTNVIYSWRNSHAAKIGLIKNLVVWQGKARKPFSQLPVRHVMYDIFVESADVEHCIGRITTNWKISAAISAKPKRLYRNKLELEKILPKHFEAASKGKLKEIIPYDDYGGPTKLDRDIERHMPNASWSTVRRIGRELRTRNQAEISKIKQAEQNEQLTKIEPL